MHQDARISSRLAWLGIIPLCVLAAAVSSVWLLFAAMHDPKGKRAWELAEGFDRLANAAIGGESEMTISAHAGRDIDRTWARALCWLLNKVDPDHCEKSWQEYQKCPRS